VEALGLEPERPEKFIGIEALPKKVKLMSSDVTAVKAFIAEECGY
jgi:threonine synthase